MKLVYLHTNPVTSNQANITQVLYMCNALSELGLVIDLYVPEGSRKLSIKELDDLVKRKISKPRNFNIFQFKTIKLFSRFKVISNYFGLRNAIMKRDGDIYFTRTPVILPAIRRVGKKAIFESHSPHLQNSIGLIDRLYKYLLGVQIKKNKKLIMITISDALKKYWVEKGFSKSKIHSLHDGFDDSIDQGDETKLDIRNRIKIKDKQIMITYIGSLYKDRGIDRILELAKIFEDCNFYVAGGPNNQKEYFQKQSSLRNLKNIFFLGWIDRLVVNDYLLSSDILLMLWSRQVPTINYCSPMKVFEYMSSGNLIVGDGYPTIREVLTDGKNALLSNPDSFDDLVLKLEEGIKQVSNPIIGMRARELAFEKYTWKKRATQIIEIMENI